MKRLLLAGSLLCLLQISALADDGHPGSEDSSRPSIVGTWVAELADASGTLNLFEAGNFSPDGSYTGANVNGLHTAHKGVWAKIGHHEYTLTILFFTHDSLGTFNGIVKARLYLTLAPDGNSYDSVAERIVMDTTGHVLSVTYPINGHSVRMNVELPQLLPPQ